MLDLSEYDNSAYVKMLEMYSKYQQTYGVRGDLFESFAVEVLGWMQVNVYGRKTIMYKGERLQDRLLSPFFTDYGFRYQISSTPGRYNVNEFDTLYNNINEIIELGLTKRYSETLARKIS